MIWLIDQDGGVRWMSITQYVSLPAEGYGRTWLRTSAESAYQKAAELRAQKESRS